MFNFIKWQRKKKDPVPLTPRQKKIYAAMTAGYIYTGTGLFVFFAAWMITRQDPYFKSQSPVLGYAVSIGVAVFVVMVEILRKHLKRKRKEKTTTSD